MRKAIIMMIILSNMLLLGCTNSLEDTYNNIKAIAIGHYHIAALQSNGNVIVWGDNSCGQCDVPEGLTDVSAIATGLNHSVALKNDGTVIVWGDNRDGQCSVPDDLIKISAISAGSCHTSVLTENGEVITWGIYANDWADPGDIKPLIDIASRHFHIMGLQNDNTVVCWGRPEFGENIMNEELNDVVSIATGSGLSIALKRDGTVGILGGKYFKIAECAKDLKDVCFVAAGSFVGGGHKKRWNDNYLG